MEEMSRCVTRLSSVNVTSSSVSSSTSDPPSSHTSVPVTSQPESDKDLAVVAINSMLGGCKYVYLTKHCIAILKSFPFTVNRKQEQETQTQTVREIL